MFFKYFQLTLRSGATLRNFLADRTVNLVTQQKAVHQPNISFSISKCIYSIKPIGVVDYAAVKNMPNEPRKMLIDVREPDELKETGQIPSSINIPLGSVSQELGVSEQVFKSKYGRDKPNADTEIVFHCKIGRRSLKAAEAAKALGFNNVKNYEGSWTDWAEREGLPK